MFEHTDKDGAPLRINAAYSPRHQDQVYVKSGPDGTYIPPALAGEAALEFLKAGGIKTGPDAPVDLGDPAAHEATALAHLILARELRARIAERAARAAKADALRQEFPELDPYQDIPWNDMTEKGKEIHLDRLARTEKVLGDTAGSPTTEGQDGGQ